MKEIDELTQSQRRAVVAQWKASGLSQAEFCRQHDIPEWKLSSWKRNESRSKTYRARRKPRQYLAKRDWSSIVSGFNSSGLTVGDYCNENGISKTSFKRARDKLAKQANTVRAATPIPSNPFLEVRMKDVRMPALGQASLEVILPGGTKVQVTEETPMHLLSKVIKALEVTC